MKLIPLTQGFYAQVDDADFDWLSQYKWYASPRKNTCYVARKVKRVQTFMHRIIMGQPLDGMTIDHKDRNGLNCQRNNLRFATFSQNMMNSKGWGKSPYAGVNFKSYNMKNGKLYPCAKWIGRICVNGRRLHLGTYDTQEEAALAYNNAAIKHFGEFACLNVIELEPIALEPKSLPAMGL